MAQPTLHPGRKLAWLTLSLLATGCASNNASSTDSLSRIPTAPRVSDIYQNRSPEVVRYDRYTLVSTSPVDAQRDPLNQMVDITMPAQMVRSVGDGFRYLLLESGYSLCPVSSSVFAELLNRPLPAVQRSIGPIRLSDGLQILAGPAWRLRIDDVNREVCFTLRDAYQTVAVSSLPVQSGTVTQTIIASTPPVRKSGNPFSSSSINTPSVPTVLPASLTPAPVDTHLKPANVPVPSPSLVPVKNANTKLLAGPSARPAVTKNSVVPLARTTSVKVAMPVKPTTALPPAPSALPAHPVVVSKPVFTPGLPVSVAPTGQIWRAEVGSTLKETLTNWAGKAKCDNGGNWVVIWPVALDYRIDAPLEFHGNFESVLVQVFDLYRRADKPLFAAASRIQCLVSVSDQPGRN